LSPAGLRRPSGARRATWDAIIRASLESFVADVCESRWTGRREREAVSLYVIGHLAPRARIGTALRDATQIAIEGAVPQLDASAGKAAGVSVDPKDQVCKDVVLWSEPRMTCWSRNERPFYSPAVVMQWKWNERDNAVDVRWLLEFSARRRGFTGYAVFATRDGGTLRLRCSRIRHGTVIRDWLVLECSDRRQRGRRFSLDHRAGRQDSRTVARGTSIERRDADPVRSAIQKAAQGGQRVVVPGKKVAVVSLADLRRLERMERAEEDRTDVQDARRARTEARAKGTVPWGRLRRQLQL
jgi:hypothetical protein